MLGLWVKNCETGQSMRKQWISAAEKINSSMNPQTIRTQSTNNSLLLTLWKWRIRNLFRHSSGKRMKDATDLLFQSDFNLWHLFGALIDRRNTFYDEITCMTCSSSMTLRNYPAQNFKMSVAKNLYHSSNSTKHECKYNKFHQKIRHKIQDA